MATTTFSSLLSLIVEIKLDFLRVNDIAVNKDIQYHISFGKGLNDQEVIYLEGNHKKYTVSIRQLAGLRCLKDGKKVKAEWLDEFRSDANGTVFQDIAQGVLDRNESMADLQFTAVQYLKVKNNQTSAPVYKDFCYEGSIEYMKAVRALLDGKTQEFFVSREYGFKMAELRSTLHSTPVRTGKDIAENLVLLPVFNVTGK